MRCRQAETRRTSSATRAGRARCGDAFRASRGNARRAPSDDNRGMTTRRQALSRSLKVAALLAGAGLLPAAALAARPQAAFDATTVPDALKGLAGGAITESADVMLTGPDIAENGAVVPVAIATTLPGVRRMALLVEKNPAVLAAVFDVSDAVEANFNIRVKMAQSSHVHAVALMDDGRVLHTSKEIRVTLGGCGA